MNYGDSKCQQWRLSTANNLFIYGFTVNATFTDDIQFWNADTDVMVAVTIFYVSFVMAQNEPVLPFFPLPSQDGEIHSVPHFFHMYTIKEQIM